MVVLPVQLVAADVGEVGEGSTVGGVRGAAGLHSGTDVADVDAAALPEPALTGASWIWTREAVTVHWMSSGVVRWGTRVPACSPV